MVQMMMTLSTIIIIDTVVAIAVNNSSIAHLVQNLFATDKIAITIAVIAAIVSAAEAVSATIAHAIIDAVIVDTIASVIINAIIIAQIIIAVIIVVVIIGIRLFIVWLDKLRSWWI